MFPDIAESIVLQPVEQTTILQEVVIRLKLVQGSRPGLNGSGILNGGLLLPLSRKHGAGKQQDGDSHSQKNTFFQIHNIHRG